MSNYIRNIYSNLKEKRSNISTKTNFVDKYGNVLLEYGYYHYNNEEPNTLFYYGCDGHDSGLHFEEFQNQLKSFFEKTYNRKVDHVSPRYVGWYRNDVAYDKGWSKERWSKMTRSEMKNSHNRHEEEFKNFLIDNNLLTESTNNMKLTKLQESKIINQFLVSDMVSLKKYFSTSEEIKKSYLGHDYTYLFGDFADENGIEYEDYDQSTMNEHMAEFDEWLYDGIENHSLNLQDSEYPAWSFFDDNPEIIKNQWLIHFTNDAAGILEHGFKYGVDEMDKLGLTTHLSEFDKKYGGYNFCYLPNDLRYAYSDRGGFKYGEDIIMFRASGIRLWHYADEEPQVIFYGNTATDIIEIQNHDGEFNVGDDIYTNENLEKVVNWVINNYNQYKKILKSK